MKSYDFWGHLSIYCMLLASYCCEKRKYTSKQLYTMPQISLKTLKISACTVCMHGGYWLVLFLKTNIYWNLDKNLTKFVFFLFLLSFSLPSPFILWSAIKLTRNSCTGLHILHPGDQISQDWSTFMLQI